MQEIYSLSKRPVAVLAMRQLKNVQLRKNAQEKPGAQAWQVHRRDLAYYGNAYVSKYSGILVRNVTDDLSSNIFGSHCSPGS